MQVIQIDIYRMEVAIWDDIDLISSFRGRTGVKFIFFLQISEDLHVECRLYGYGLNTNKF